MAERAQRGGNPESIGRLVARELRSGNKKKCLSPDCDQRPLKDDDFCMEHARQENEDATRQWLENGHRWP